MISKLTRIISALGADTDHFELEDLAAAEEVLDGMLSEQFREGYHACDRNYNAPENWEL